jgi:hypothetical protein
MKLGKLSVLSAAALLAGGMSFAVAQSNMAPAGSSGASAQGKCWDSASNQIKDKANSPGTSSASGEKKPGDLTTGSKPSGSSPATARPAAAAGLPNC